MPVSRLPAARRDRGFTMVELLIATAVALFLVAGLVLMFVSSSRSARELDTTTRQIENGQYALKILGNEFNHAGYLSYFNPAVAAIATPAALPDPCSATTETALRAALGLHIQGYDNANPLACINDWRDGTDVVVIRRVSACVTGSSADCPVVAGVPYFQAASCQTGTQLGSPDINNHFRLVYDRSKLDRTRRNCTAVEEDRRFLVYVFYIANNFKAGDGLPTLMRAELGAGGIGNAIPIASGIENLQLEYGVDRDGDGAPDVFTADPGTLLNAGGAACAGVECVEFWRDTMAVKIHLLARTPRELSGEVDTKEFRLGRNVDGSELVIPAANDRYRRTVFESVARLNNPSMRRE